MSWPDGALCPSVDPELFFPQNAAGAAAPKKVCLRCPVRTACLVDALNEERGLGPRSRHGVRGGMDAHERSRLAVSQGELIREGGNGERGFQEAA